MKSWTRFPFVRYTVALSAGVTMFLLVESTPRLLWGIGMASVACAVFFFVFPPKTRQSHADLLRGIPALAAIFVAGWLLAGLRSNVNDPTHFQQIPRFDAYEVVLVSQPESKSTYFRAFAEVRRVRTVRGWQAVTGRVLLSMAKPIPRLAYGQILLVRGAPQPVQPPLNPGEFDYRRYLRFQQVFHRDFIRQDRWVNAGFNPPNLLIDLACRVNRRADSVLVARLGDRREYGVAKAMLLGVRDDLDADVMRAYSASGAIHVLSVSGLHVGILFVLLGIFLNPFKKQGGKGVLWAILALKLTLLWAYAALTGLSPAVLRSAAMFSLFILAEAMKRPPTAYNTLFASAFGLLLVDPFLLASAGFQLSYLAVLGLIYLQPRIERWWRVDNFVGNWLWKITATALAAQVVTFPLVVYYFHQFPVYFLFVNPAVIGLASLAVPAGLFFLVAEQMPLLGDVLLFFTRLLFWLLNEVAVQTERLPHAIWTNLHLGVGETVGIYGLLVSMIALFFTRNKAYAWVAASLAIVLSGWAGFQKKVQHSQQGWVIHHVPRHSVISLVDGNTLTVLADSAVVVNPRLLDYACAGFWAERGIRFTRLHRLDSAQRNGTIRIEEAGNGVFALTNKHQLVLIGTQPTGRISAAITPTVTLIIQGAGRMPFGLSSPSVPVLDGTVPPWVVARWQERGVPVHATAERGAWVAGF